MVLVFSLLLRSLWMDVSVVLGGRPLASKMMRLTEQLFPYCDITSDANASLNSHPRSIKGEGEEDPMY